MRPTQPACDYSSEQERRDAVLRDVMLRTIIHTMKSFLEHNSAALKIAFWIVIGLYIFCPLVFALFGTSSLSYRATANERFVPGRHEVLKTETDAALTIAMMFRSHGVPGKVGRSTTKLTFATIGKRSACVWGRRGSSTEPSAVSSRLGIASNFLASVSPQI